MEVQVKKDEGIILEDKFIQTDPSFFSIFSFEIISVDAINPLNDNKSIVISEYVAEKYLPGIKPIGQIIEILHRDRIYRQHVSAVYKNIPDNSHIQADFILPIYTTIWGYENINRKRSRPSFESWSSNDFLTYLEFSEHFEKKESIQKLPEFIQTNLPNKTFSGHDFSFTYDLQPIKDIHLLSKHINSDVTNKGNLNHGDEDSSRKVF